MTKKRKSGRLDKALLETADDMRRAGILDAAGHDKITLRYLGGGADMAGKPMSGKEIRSLRERAHLNQAVFARCLNFTVGYKLQNIEDNNAR
jgi:putative transcriptional regulator